ncbi:MAG: hypothetical protein IPM98_05570 [Lewinellaceae bacterium]|nr:hypothetical protein [Lewinellaceae bacterium]
MKKHILAALLLLFGFRAAIAQCTADAGPDQTLTCAQQNVMLEGSSNVSGATFSWSGPNSFSSTQQIPVVNDPGIYILIITDPSDGCVATDSVLVLEDLAEPDVLISQPDTLTCQNPQVMLSAWSPEPNAFYEWHGPNGFFSFQQNTLVSAPGIYFVFVQNLENGCVAVAEVEVLQDIDLIVASTLVCEETISVSPAGGVQPYTYVWSNGQTGPSVTFLPPGTYMVTISDATGCMTIYTTNLPANAPPCTRITGKITYDENTNCQKDTLEAGQKNWFVTAQGAGGTFYGLSDANGDYTVWALPGDYTVSVAAIFPNTVFCGNDFPASLLSAGDVDTVDFLVQLTNPDCPLLTVNLTTPLLRRCFSNNYYTIQYCNVGPELVHGAYVTLELDPSLVFFSASIPIINLGNNTYRFNLGSVPAGLCGTFKVQVQVSCNALPGQTHCSEARIYPDSICDPANPLWSGAQLEVKSECVGDSLHFILKNIGLGDMSQELEYIVIEDGIMLRTNTAPALPAGGEMQVTVPANGATWRIEAEQEPFSPRPTQPVLSVVGSYDPNDKQGFPVGYGPDHYVRPGTELEYLIRFQNTGTDTAFTVVIRDTLSEWLDPLTVRPGASSHGYRFDLTGAGILIFDFQNILLPDSNVNEPASHGFVQFRISPRTDVPLETNILNHAAIYFDFNDPIITNTTQHRIGENFLTVGLWQPLRPEYAVQVAPHPLTEASWVTIPGAPESGDYRLYVFDLTGRSVQEITADTPQFLLQKDALTTGMYLFRVERDGLLLGSGKLVVR